MSKRRVYDTERHIQFVTFSCYKRRKFLNPDRAKRIVIGTLGSQIALHQGVCIAYVIMPNHVHALLWSERAKQLSSMMNHWKDQSSHRLKELYRTKHPEYWQHVNDADPIWLPRFFPFNVHTERKIQQKINYIHDNPVRAKLAATPCNWPWSSARWYLQGKSVGIPIGMPEL